VARSIDKTEIRLFKLDHVQGLRRIFLATKDAHGLYQNYGFKVTGTPANWMEVKNYDVYNKLDAELTDANSQS
jgi:hypothetical protein